MEKSIEILKEDVWFDSRRVHLAEYSPDSLLNYNSTFAQQSIQHLCDYYSSPQLLKTIDSLIWVLNRDSVLAMIGQNCLDANQLISVILGYDVTNNEFLDSLYNYDRVKFDMVYNMLGGSPVPPPTKASEIFYIRTQPDNTVANVITSQFSRSELRTVISTLSSPLLDSAFIGTSNYSPCGLFAYISSCDYDTTWFAFVRSSP